MDGGGAVWLRRAGAALAVVLVLAAALVVLAVIRAGGPGDTRVTKDYGRVTVLSLDTGASDVTIRAGTTDRVTVTRETVGSPKVSQRLRDGTLKITSGCPDLSFRRCGVDYDIVVPRTVRVDAEVQSGDVTVRGVPDVAVAAGSGDVDVSTVSKSARLHTQSGNIAVHGGSGRLDLRAESGDVTATGLSGSAVTADAESGNVTLAFTRPPGTVRVGTHSGDAEVRVPRGDTYRVDARTSSGDKSVRVPTGAGADRTIKVTTHSGNLTVRAR